MKKAILAIMALTLLVIGCGSAPEPSQETRSVQTKILGERSKTFLPNGDVISHEIAVSLLEKCKDGKIETETGPIGCPEEVAIHTAPEPIGQEPILEKDKLEVLMPRHVQQLYTATSKNAAIVQWRYQGGGWAILGKCVGVFVSPHVLRTRADCDWILGESVNRTWADAISVYTDENNDGLVETYWSVSHRFVGLGWVNRWADCWNQGSGCAGDENYEYMVVSGAGHPYYHQNGFGVGGIRSSAWYARGFQQSTDQFRTQTLYNQSTADKGVYSNCNYPNEPDNSQTVEATNFSNAEDYNDKAMYFLDSGFSVIGHTIERNYYDTPGMTQTILVRDCGDWRFFSDRIFDGDDINETFNHAKSIAGD